MYAVYSTETNDSCSEHLNTFLGLFSTIILAVKRINSTIENNIENSHNNFSYAIYKCKLDVPVIVNEYYKGYSFGNNIIYYSNSHNDDVTENMVESDVESEAEEKFTTLASYLWNNYFR